MVPINERQRMDELLARISPPAGGQFPEYTPTPGVTSTTPLPGTHSAYKQALIEGLGGSRGVYPNGLPRSINGDSRRAMIQALQAPVTGQQMAGNLFNPFARGGNGY